MLASPYAQLHAHLVEQSSRARRRLALLLPPAAAEGCDAWFSSRVLREVANRTRL